MSRSTSIAVLPGGIASGSRVMTSASFVSLALLSSASMRCTASRPVKMPARRPSFSITSTAPTRRSRMHRQASRTVASGGSVSGSWFLTMSDIFLMVIPFCGRPPLASVHRPVLLASRSPQLDPARMNVPVADTFEPREAFLRRFDRSFRTASSSNDYRALTAVEKLLVSGNVIDERHAIAWHLSGSQAWYETAFWCTRCRGRMIWIKFSALARSPPSPVMKVGSQRLRKAALMFVSCPVGDFRVGLEQIARVGLRPVYPLVQVTRAKYPTPSIDVTEQ